MTDVACTGMERKLIDCLRSNAALGSCGDGSHAGVKCIEPCDEGSIRLRGSITSFEGRVQICSNLTWTTVCAEDWDNEDADVACGQLRFLPYGASATGVPGQSTLGVTGFHCNGSEDNVTACLGSDIEPRSCRSHASIVCLVVPVVHVIASHTKVRPNGTATLMCAVTVGNPMNYTYSWTNDGIPLTGETTDTINLTSFSVDQAGTYSCEVMNEVGAGMSNIDITIELGGAPEVTIQVSLVGPVIEGSTVNFVCEATAGDLPISYSWTGPSGQNVFLGDTDGAISIRFSASGDYGIYTCTATNEFGVAHASTEVIQAVPPVVGLATGQIVSPEVTAREDMTLSVYISGFNRPLTSISWAQNGNTFTISEGRVTITNAPMLPSTSAPVTSTFLLSAITPRDSGSYTVIGTNGAGNSVLQFMVSVTDPVNITDPPADVAKTGDEGGVVTFTCTASGVPAPTITWSLASEDAGRIRTTSSSALTDGEGFISVSSTLTISNIMINDAGHYTCIASNTETGPEIRVFTLQVNPISGPALAVNVLPTVLFSGGSRSIVEGSVVWLYCQVNSIALTLTVTWTKDGVPLVQDVPHIRMRSSSSAAASSTFLLVVDTFRGSDSGVYQCTAEDRGDTAIGTALTLTASVSTIGSLRFISSTANSDIFFRNRAGYRSGDTAIVEYDVGHVYDNTTTFMTPRVTWLRDGVPVSTAPTNTPGSNGRLNTTLSFIFNEESGVGVYQCAFIDITRSEILVTDPIRLDTGETLTVEAISPSPIIIRPPEKLVLEVRTTGRYFLTSWSRNGITAGLPAFPVSAQSFVHFGEVYVAESTTVEDLGGYEVVLGPVPNSNESIPSSVRFDVILPDGAKTSVSSGADVVSVSEGERVDISCTSVGVPIPVISWTLYNETTFSQTDTSTDHILSGGNFEVTPGSVVSTLHLVNAQYPADEGVYVCTGSNTHAGVTATTSATIEVKVLVLPVVVVTADRTRVGPGGAATLNCTVTRGNPMTYTYSWIHEDVPLAGETSDTLGLSSFSTDDNGTYSCVVMNKAGTGMDSVTIVLGEYPGPPADVTIIDAGSRWIAMRWTPTSSGSGPVLRFILYLRDVGRSESYLQLATIAPSEGSVVMYNVSRGGVVEPYSQYSFKVKSCNEIGCSELSSESDITLTNQDSPSAPANLTVNSTTGTTLTLEWQPPLSPNGIIFAYRISFSGFKHYNTTFSHIDVVTLRLSMLQTEEGVVTGVVVRDLIPGTMYTVTVAGVNGAMREDGLGVTSDPVQANTLIAPPPGPVIPSLEDLPTPADDNDIRTVIIPLPQFSTLNGPISHYHVVVVILPLGQTPDDLDDPDTLYDSIDDLDTYRGNFCEEDISEAIAYITAEFGADLFPDSEIFVVGGDSPNDRPDLYTNGLLCFGGHYTFFVRAYPQLDLPTSDSGRFARQLSARQYNVFTSSNYFASTTIDTPTIFLFQLRLQSVSDCGEWTADNPDVKTNEIIRQVVNELSLRCQCNFEARQITDASFQCFPESPTAVTFRAELTESHQPLAVQLTGFLEEWVSQGPYILVETQSLAVDDTCAVVVPSFSEEECKLVVTSTTVSTTGVNTSLVGGVVGVVVVVLVLVVVVVLAIMLVFWRHKKKTNAYEPASQQEPDMVTDNMTETIQLIMKDPDAEGQGETHYSRFPNPTSGESGGLSDAVNLIPCPAKTDVASTDEITEQYNV